jgi:hypothetical protein
MFEIDTKITIAEGQHWIHRCGEIKISDRQLDVVTISEFHQKTGSIWKTHTIKSGTLAAYLRSARARLIISPGKIWKDLCLK